MEANALLEIRDVRKHYPVTHGFIYQKTTGQVKAIDGISLTVRQGETLALVGESGCGKTTTAKLILRIEKPTGGQLLMEGEDIGTLSRDQDRQYRMDVQAVFQDPWSSLNPRMRVRDIVAEPLEVSGIVPRGEIPDRVLSIMEDVGLRKGQGGLFPHEFSGGQRQRIAVAAALVSNPRLIILDEPVSALDVSIRAQIMNLFKDLKQKYGMSYLLIAHDLATTRYMSDTIAVMYLGKIVEYVDTEELFREPMHPYTKALFSAALPGDPDIQREEIVLSGEVPSPLNPPSGCSFHPRCPMKCGAICERETPALKAVNGGTRMVACHLY